MVTENELELSAVPFAVVTEITPVVAPSGTVVVIDVEVFVPIVAEMPLNFTAVALPSAVQIGRAHV